MKNKAKEALAALAVVGGMLGGLNNGQRYCIRYQATIYDAKKNFYNPAYVVETTKWVTGNESTQTTEIACPLPSELKGKDLSETMIIRGRKTGRYRVFTGSTGSKRIRMYEFMNGRSSGEDIRQLIEKPKLPEEAEREDKE